MRAGVLGQLTVHIGDASALPAARKPRKVLALLLLNANHVVPISALIEELWDVHPPYSALTTLQTYILQLRKLLGGALGETSAQVAKHLLVTRPGGYLLNVRPGELDVHEFDRLSAAGARALGTGEDELAADMLRRALAVWRGPALVDVEAGRLLEVQIARLEESRLTVLEQRIEADLRLGRHHMVIGELRGLTAANPLHESLHGHYMLALYRAGRRPHALDVFGKLRAALVEEIGLEPSPKLARLHRAILASDPVLDSAAPRQNGMLLDRLPTAA